MVAMSGKTWNGLSADAKRAIDKAGGAAGAKLIGARWDAADAVGKSDANKVGNKINVIDPAEKSKWANAIQIINDNWVKKANSKGKDGKALIADLRKMMGG